MNINKKIVIILMISMFMFFLTGCGNSTISRNVTTVSEVTNRSAVNSGWQAFEAGGYSSAKASFEDALKNNDGLDEETEAKLYNGLGWATVKTDGFKNAGEHFKKAKIYSDDAKVGRAGYYLHTMDKDNFQKGIELLEDLNIHNAKYVYEFENCPDVTNAQVHALLGVLYYLNGDLGKAGPQFKEAGVIVNSPGEEMSSQTINAIINAFGR
ncbi:MAG: hypothetical protein ACQESP_11695 [Candidatus Muiribacteriota bacterium]